ncbi:hypothetical protein PIB30_112211 [Stylosanthes scabra]|uniref:Uncharacterized protein n=1 Tax=Stylosanthes scabra TaxID=79078 RepID=A0ABU6VZ97_9FABA|nr:hypothetical protein [Stylosanthes scabra]
MLLRTPRILGLSRFPDKRVDRWRWGWLGEKLCEVAAFPCHSKGLAAVCSQFVYPCLPNGASPAGLKTGTASRNPDGVDELVTPN